MIKVQQVKSQPANAAVHGLVYGEAITCKILTVGIVLQLKVKRKLMHSKVKHDH